MNAPQQPFPPQQDPQQQQPYPQQPFPQQQYQQQPFQAPAKPPKKHIVYILLAVFLGSLGIHNFYAGYTGKGVAQLLISIISCGCLSVVSWIWAIIEICTVHTDASGQKMV